MDLRGAPAREFEAIRQRLKTTRSYMVVMQHDDGRLNDEALKALCTDKVNKGGYFLFNTRGRCAEQDPSWERSLGFWTNLPGLTRSFDDPGGEVHLHHELAKQVADAAFESAFARFQRTESARRWGGTFFTVWPTQLIGSLAKVDRQRAELINQELQEKFCQMFQSEAIDFACEQNRVLREHFPQVARSHREEVLPPELEEIFEPRQMVLDEPADDETETARALSEREKRELFRQHRNLKHPQPSELARALRHAGAKREAIRFVLKEMRCPTCEARPLPLPPRPGMLPRCLQFNQCIGVDLVELEVRDGTSAKALNVVCWRTDLQIVQALWNGYTAHAVMTEFKAVW